MQKVVNYALTNDVNSSKCIKSNEADFQPIMDEEKVYSKNEIYFALCKSNKNTFDISKLTLAKNANMKFFAKFNLKDYFKHHLS